MIGDYSSSEEFAAKLKGGSLKKPAVEAQTEPKEPASAPEDAEDELVPSFSAAESAKPDWDEKAEERQRVPHVRRRRIASKAIRA